MIVTVDEPLVGPFELEMLVGRGVSNVNDADLVPTTAETVTTVTTLDPAPAPDKHWTAVLVYHDVVVHNSPPMVTVGVASSAPKLSPLSVSEFEPDAYAVPSMAVSTGPSNVSAPTRVPTTAEMVTVRAWLP